MVGHPAQGPAEVGWVQVKILKLTKSFTRQGPEQEGVTKLSLEGALVNAQPLAQRHKPATPTAAVSLACFFLCPFFPQLWQLSGLLGKVGLPARRLVDQG